ncbi:HEPN domain-containing protein [candidate division KSB1 bacterium]|nr:HEPN domain-containing protein [candidate division KSB1 bacterium]
MKKNNVEYVKEWLLFARDNLIAAKKSIKSDFEGEHFIPCHTVCFICQGCAEKYLKAYLIWNGWRLKKIHD